MHFEQIFIVVNFQFFFKIFRLFWTVWFIFYKFPSNFCQFSTIFKKIQKYGNVFEILKKKVICFGVNSLILFSGPCFFNISSQNLFSSSVFFFANLVVPLSQCEALCHGIKTYRNSILQNIDVLFLYFFVSCNFYKCFEILYTNYQ